MTSPSTRGDQGSSVDARLRALDAELDGSVHLPGDPDWDLVRQAWNLAADQHPCAVVFAETAADVRDVVRLAAAHGRRVYAGALFFPAERAAEVLYAWRRWTTDVPDTVTSMGRLLAFPQLSDVPEPMRGRRFVLVEAAFLGDVAAAEALLAPLRDLQPLMDTFEVVPAPALSAINMDPEAPTPAIADHVVLRDLSPDAIDALLSVVGPDAPLVSVELRHLGGALARPDPDHGALDVLSGPYLAFALGVPSGPDMVASIEAAVRALPVAMRDWAAGTGYANFADQPAPTSELLGADVADRLFLANHPVDTDD